jgi:hypothetical protein
MTQPDGMSRLLENYYRYVVFKDDENVAAEAMTTTTTTFVSQEMSNKITNNNTVEHKGFKANVINARGCNALNACNEKTSNCMCVSNNYFQR